MLDINKLLDVMNKAVNENITAVVYLFYPIYEYRLLEEKGEIISASSSYKQFQQSHAPIILSMLTDFQNILKSEKNTIQMMNFQFSDQQLIIKPVKHPYYIVIIGDIKVMPARFILDSNKLCIYLQQQFENLPTIEIK